MPGKNSAAKRHRQSEKRRLRNKAFKTRVKTFSKRYLESVNSASKEGSEKHYRELSGLLDKAVSKGIFHKNTAARKKSRLHRLLKQS